MNYIQLTHDAGLTIEQTVSHKESSFVQPQVYLKR